MVNNHYHIDTLLHKEAGKYFFFIQQEDFQVGKGASLVQNTILLSRHDSLYSYNYIGSLSQQVLINIELKTLPLEIEL